MRFLLIALSVVAVLATANTAKADRRVAFVVGNGAYRNMPPLANPPLSAKSMAELLRKADFEVFEGADLTRDRMTERLLEFGRKAADADLAVFYYCGHGIAMGGANYLVPVDADLKSEMDVKLGGAINIGLTIDQTLSDAKVKLVFIDASRINPFAASARASGSSRNVSIELGLAEMISPDNSLIAFAAAPGQAANDGPAGTIRPFTRALIANIATPGIEIQQAMTLVRAQLNQETKGAQSSWMRTNLAGPVILNPVKAK